MDDEERQIFRLVVQADAAIMNEELKKHPDKELLKELRDDYDKATSLHYNYREKKKEQEFKDFILKNLNNIYDWFRLGFVDWNKNKMFEYELKCKTDKTLKPYEDFFNKD